jgi:hypothetical protein
MHTYLYLALSAVIVVDFHHQPFLMLAIAVVKPLISKLVLVITCFLECYLLYLLSIVILDFSFNWIKWLIRPKSSYQAQANASL